MEGGGGREEEPPAVRAALARLAGRPGAACRRLKNEILQQWSRDMREALLCLDVDKDGSVVAIFRVGDDETWQRLSIEFPARYPFHAPVPRVAERAVAHGAEVARALRGRLPLVLVAAVRRHLRAPRRTPLKEWAYHRLRRLHGDEDERPARCVAACTRELPPHHWSPCMRLAQQWGGITRLVRRCSVRLNLPLPPAPPPCPTNSRE